MVQEARGEELVGITFAKQFPNPAEPLRGLFVAEQVRATRSVVDWRIIAPVPFAPRWLAKLLRKPFVRGGGTFDSIPVERPRYPVLPRRLLFTTVAPSMALAARSAFAKAAREADFVHVHDIYPSGAAARRLAVPAGKPLVLTVHGSDLYTNVTRPRWAAEVRAAVAAATLVICVSESLAHDVVSLAGADPERVQVIPDTYDAERFAYVPRTPSDGGPTRFITVGRLVPVKGHDVLVNALGSAVAQGLDATLDIVGGGPERAELERLARERELEARIRFLGPLGGGELVDALAQADVFVLPSRKEGLGVALVEALATGLPAIATRSGGPQDILGPEDGLLVPPEDMAALASAMITLAEQREAYSGEAIARRIRERFGPEVVGGRLVAAYRVAIERAAQDRGGRNA
jgi:teichuronic acid biosynthesis glycosyltransferase TuaC